MNGLSTILHGDPGLNDWDVYFTARDICQRHFKVSMNNETT